MNRLLPGLLALAIAAGMAANVFAVGSDYSKEQLAAAGRHCVHGFWVNEQTVEFYAGDAALLNRDLTRFLEGTYATRKVVLHVGTKRAESPWDTKPREVAADWSVNSWDDPEDAAKAVPRMHLQVDVWLGSRIELNALEIPAGFEVVSGGEIESYLQRRKQGAK